MPGSSPLARGLRQDEPGDERTQGIIPARAGFTNGWGAQSGRVGDHPRSRGVYRSDVKCSGVSPGSSPLARGLLVSVWQGMQPVRIIPARAGFT